MTRPLLDLAYLLLAIVCLPVLLRKKRGGWAERLGRIEPLPDPEPGRPRVMIHTVSVGETNLVRSLVSALAERADVLVTVTTDTGHARATELYEGLAHVRRYPLDFSRSVRRFLDAARPDAVALVELELWPQFVRECALREIPVAIINGRLSERSFRRYRAFRWLIGRVFRRAAWVGAQSEAYAQRFREMGCESVHVLDTMKWDAAPADGPSGAETLVGS